jgi:high affinity Mn2+ porin
MASAVWAQSGEPAEAPPPAAPSQSFDWNGWYAGGHIGLAGGSSRWSARGAGGFAPSLSGFLDLYNPPHLSDGTGSYLGGLQAGYNFVTGRRLLLGAETDASFPNTVSGTSNFLSPVLGQGSYQDKVLASGTVRARLGYAFDPLLFYGTGGFAWTYDRLTRTGVSSTSSQGNGVTEEATLFRPGWALGGGVELPIGPKWSVKLEYQYSSFAGSDTEFQTSPRTSTSDLVLQKAQLGFNYHIDGHAGLADAITKGPSLLELDWLALHGQTTFVGQYAPSFHAPYRGQNSLLSNQARETWDVTLYAGIRLWDGAEIWINPEVDQGFGLTDTQGLAGFSSGEAYKVGERYPYARVPRLFLRQTIALSGDPEDVDADINQFPRRSTSNRLVFTVGKFGVPDIFDTNRYAHDPRSDFLNWALIDTGSFDYAADAWGYTYGAAAEWYQGQWTLRGGGFDLSTVPNGTELDPSFAQFQLVGEVERRFEIWQQPGKIAVTPWLSRGRMGNYNDAVRLAQMNGQPADLAAVRHYRSRAGVGANLEQQVTADWGLFIRAGFASPDVEPYEFTDIDRTIATGAVVSGRPWQRPDDTFGLAGVMNGISGNHETFLNAGGLGLLIGDGRLPHAGLEQILETYYCLAVNSLRITLDYQFFNNPAYNRDRGPVSVVGLRLHSQF